MWIRPRICAGISFPEHYTAYVNQLKVSLINAFNTFASLSLALILWVWYVIINLYFEEHNKIVTFKQMSLNQKYNLYTLHQA